QRGNMQRLVALARDLDVIDMRTLSREDLHRSIYLVANSGRPFMALDQHQPRAGFDDHDATRVNRRRGLAAEDMSQMDRALDAGVLAYMDHDAAGHERGVERHRDVVARGFRNIVQPIE